MKRLPILVMLLVTGTFLAFQSLGKSSNPPSKYEKILRNVGQMLAEAHYSPKDINDEFSKKIFKKYLNDLDPDKNIFLQTDYDALKKYETKIDDEIKGDAPVEFFLAAGQIFNKRIEEVAKIYNQILDQPFNYTVDETINLNDDKLKVSATESDLREAWRKRLKYLALDRYAESADIREKNKGKENFVAKTDEELEKDAREKVRRAMNRTFDRYRHKFSDDDKFSIFVNDITTAMDPHTEFFPPVDKRYFDEQMSGSFFGIGAQLAYDDGNIKIASLVTGTPAWKSGEVQVGDIILKVAQGSNEPVDLTGYVVEDAVKLIRGSEGTEVKLTLKKSDGSVKVISLIRAKIVQEETFARSAIVKNGSEKIGYIYLPEFYADFEHSNGARCSADVAKEIMKLKEEKVDGIIMDLRNNGGGSLYDVVQMAGLFIEEGPIVQVKDREGKLPQVLRDKDRSVLYDGPLAVMVNEFSASASEIFAAAIQDYNRGIIIGSTSTYGKGTVQRNIGLDFASNLLGSNSELGTIKLTLQKFYRINGGSTQLKGVSSDIVLSDKYEQLKLREKDDSDALPWDEISKANYSPWNPGYDVATIKRLEQDRLNNSDIFKTIKANSEWLEKQKDKERSLRLDKYRQEEKAIQATVKQNETLEKSKDSLDISFVPRDENMFANDKIKQERFNNWLKGLTKDIYLDQAVKVMNDMINQKNLAQTSKQPAKAF
ncbi:MAG TPA: carboxy terminal-processing peptidase [Chitinophagaceae bacterium]|nr:carboxy terminal-processing peptidase [Chitinophagaceae bacterium]